jgi:(p)ppGpp synthase/HD superfamily hydrolase
MIAASVLHDVLEDTALTEDDLIAKGFGGEVVYFVKQMTNASKLDATLKDKPRAVRKAADRAKLANACWEVKMIKLADRIDNLRDMNHSATPADFAVMYKNESKQLLEVLKGTDAELEAQLEKLIG